MFPNPASNLIAVQVGHLVSSDLNVDLVDIAGKILRANKINKGQTITYFDTQTLYEGIYFVKISDQEHSSTHKIVIKRD